MQYTPKNEIQEKLLQKRQQTGKCVLCQCLCDTQWYHCSRCLRRVDKQKHKDKKPRTLCKKCCRILHSKGQYCDRCKEEIALSRRKRSSGGTCTVCYRYWDDPSKPCPGCKERTALKRKKLQAKRDKAGLCTRCGEKCNYPGKKCLVCHMKAAASSHLKSVDKWKLLLLLLEDQDGLCAYTGEPLILGENASLDHIVPRSRGGSNDIDNLQWVTRTVNWAKSNLSHEAFLGMCKAVALNAPNYRKIPAFEFIETSLGQSNPAQ